MNAPLTILDSARDQTVFSGSLAFAPASAPRPTSFGKAKEIVWLSRSAVGVQTGFVSALPDWYVAVFSFERAVCPSAGAAVSVASSILIVMWLSPLRPPLSIDATAEVAATGGVVLGLAAGPPTAGSHIRPVTLPSNMPASRVNVTSTEPSWFLAGQAMVGGVVVASAVRAATFLGMVIVTIGVMPSGYVMAAWPAPNSSDA
ncbi:MAG: hypothetical protein F4Y01_05565 [Gammaproteobacteria bacterium]|nr:hypothetical protein [Gammaproteobacteria bacterium]